MKTSCKFRRVNNSVTYLKSFKKKEKKNKAFRKFEVLMCKIDVRYGRLGSKYEFLHSQRSVYVRIPYRRQLSWYKMYSEAETLWRLSDSVRTKKEERKVGKY
jgi:hypothetical protein